MYAIIQWHSIVKRFIEFKSLFDAPKEIINFVLPIDFPVSCVGILSAMWASQTVTDYLKTELYSYNKASYKKGEINNIPKIILGQKLWWIATTGKERDKPMEEKM